MNAPARLTLYGAGLLALFGIAFAMGGAVIPESLVASWTERASTATDHDPQSAADAHHPAEGAVQGVSSSSGDLLLGPVAAPTAVGEEGSLAFRVETTAGGAVTEFEIAHEQELHLIVVRSDGAEFRHVHPAMSRDGTWTIPWRWDAAGSYRVYADFTPSSTGTATTLTRTVHVAGELVPRPAEAATSEAEVDGFAVTVAGDLIAGTSSTLTAMVTRDGAPVTTLEPYLGAYGHLVALRDGDLAYLHVHPVGVGPSPGETSGPEIAFAVDVPTPGRYLLFLDFRVDDAVRTAHFVVDAGTGSADDASEHSDH